MAWWCTPVASGCNGAIMPSGPASVDVVAIGDAAGAAIVESEPDRETSAGCCGGGRRQIFIAAAAPCLFDEEHALGRCCSRCRLIFNEIFAP